MFNHTSHTRTIHLVDLENLCGVARPTMTEAAAVRRLYEAAVAPGATDHFIVAVNHGAALCAGLAWKGCRLLLRSGPNGADEALLEVLRHERVHDRFTAVTIGSGDGIFAQAATWLASKGVDVTVVASRDALAPRLRLAAHHVVEVDLAIWAEEAA